MALRLILTTSDSGAGHLKMMRRGDKVLAFGHRLVRDPVPAADDMSTFFAERRSLYQINPAQFGTWVHNEGDGTTERLEEIASWWNECEIVEFWADPDSNSQLILIQFLDWVDRQNFAVEKLKLVHAQTRLGDQNENDFENPLPIQVESLHFNVARVTWAAFRHSTPENWAKLLRDDLSALPFLSATVLRMLEELPAEDTGLGASEARILTLAERGAVEAEEILRAFVVHQELPTLQYWEVGKVMDLLSEAPNAALVGLGDGPFDMALHDNRDAFKRYMRSRLSLTLFGQALVDRREDFTRKRQIDRWWGGTRLTNDNCWRWRSAEKVLLMPT